GARAERDPRGVAEAGAHADHEHARGVRRAHPLRSRSLGRRGEGSEDQGGLSAPRGAEYGASHGCWRRSGVRPPLMHLPGFAARPSYANVIGVRLTSPSLNPRLLRAAIALAAAAVAMPAWPLASGERAPGCSAPAVDGGRAISLADYRGKVVY